MANTVGKRSSSKYKAGQEVTGRIMDVDVSKKRVSMTLKKLLCSDKLPLITTFQVRALAAFRLSVLNKCYTAARCTSEPANLNFELDAKGCR